jgi:hypothetical protein
MLWLKNIQNCPPGEFFYRQDGKFFEASPLIGTVASNVSNYRKANNLPRSLERECLEDIIVFTVARLDPKSEWVYNTDQTIDALMPSGPVKGCQGCGAKIG